MVVGDLEGRWRLAPAASARFPPNVTGRSKTLHDAFPFLKLRSQAIRLQRKWFVKFRWILALLISSLYFAVDRFLLVEKAKFFDTVVSCHGLSAGKF